MTTAQPSPAAREAPPHPVMQLTVAPGRTVPAMARTFVRGCADVLGATPNADAILLTSEVVTNAVQHADTRAVVILVERVGSALHVAVLDDDPSPPVLQPDEPGQAGGFGVRLVDQLAASWGVDDLVEDGKRVWFEIELPG